MYKGRYVKVDINNPSAAGVCDRSGFVFNHEDLVKQMEWRGNKLVWTGMLVGPPFVDKPNRQNKPPRTKDDPRAIRNSRVPEGYIPIDSNPAPEINNLTDELNNIVWQHKK